MLSDLIRKDEHCRAEAVSALFVEKRKCMWRAAQHKQQGVKPQHLASIGLCSLHSVKDRTKLGCSVH